MLHYYKGTKIFRTRNPIGTYYHKRVWRFNNAESFRTTIGESSARHIGQA